MNTLSADQALEMLADIAWWFKGFAAARPPSIDEGDGAHLELRDHTRALRLWIVGLVRGNQRRLVIDKDEVILITLRELEEMREGLAPLHDGDALKTENLRIVEQRQRGWTVAQFITEEYAQEERSANNPNIPF